ncbi:hypothetical protein BO221_23435 [Archangium sp. Cb G35]|uniref:hypothetical protein n=1 Tax=Archangium sp. Cb G35 TaxID=1920190 RepID=UPI000937ABA7|nr:hypothetical protein [Archangium sp. Cb G35]OJT22706.1 hypothetical protein BO221_23435 [Archangium sp. Cb G35]
MAPSEVFELVAEPLEAPWPSDNLSADDVPVLSLSEFEQFAALGEGLGCRSLLASTAGTEDP